MSRKLFALFAFLLSALVSLPIYAKDPSWVKGVIEGSRAAERIGKTINRSKEIDKRYETQQMRIAADASAKEARIDAQREKTIIDAAIRSKRLDVELKKNAMNNAVRVHQINSKRPVIIQRKDSKKSTEGANNFHKRSFQEEAKARSENFHKESEIQALEALGHTEKAAQKRRELHKL